jgi:chitodextrinase
VPTITWNPASSPVTIGQTFGALRLNATAANPHTTAAAFAPTTAPTYRVTAGPALVGQTITASTTVNATGTYTVEAAWAQTANFAAASTTRTITVDAGIVPNGSVTPGAANIGDRVSIYRDGTTTLPYAWTETTIWRPDGTAAASFIDFTAQGVRQFQVNQAGTWYYQMRLVDSAYNFRDQWIPFTVDLPRQNLPYTTSFEQSQGFIVNGNLFPQQGWIVQQGAADVSAEQARTGTHGVKLIGGAQRAQVLKAFNASGSRTFLDLYLRPVAAAAVGDSSVFYFGASRLGFTIVQAGTGALQIFRGDGQGGGAWVDTGYRFPLNASAQATQWMRVTIEHDYTARVWQLIVDGVRVRSDIPVRSNAETTFTDLTWTGTTTAAAYVDDFAATTTNPFPAPAAPAGLSASNITDGSASLSWQAPASPLSPVVGYEVQRSGGANTSATTTSLAVTGLVPDTQYTFAVRARNQAGYWSAWSTGFNVRTLPDQTPPTVPGALTSSEVTPVSVRLSWTASTDNVAVTGYRITRTGAPTLTTTNVSEVVSGLLPQRTYQFSVQAFDARGNVSGAASIQVATPAPDLAADYDNDGVSTGVELELNLNPYTDPNDVRVFRYTYDKANQLQSGPGGTYVRDAEGNLKKVKP